MAEVEPIAAVAMIIAIVAMGTAIAGLGSPADLQNYRAGSQTITTVAGQISYGPVAVTFSPPLTATPSVIDLSYEGSGFSVNSGSSVITFLAVGGSSQTDGTWTSMPSAKTELFSPSLISHVCCRTFVQLSGLTSCTLSVGVITYSNTVGAALSVQWATSTSGPWTDFSGSSVDVHSIVAQPSVSNTFNPATGQAGQVYLRIVGVNGGGVGDNPQFGLIEMACTAGFAGVTPSWQVPTSIGFNLFLTLVVPDPVGGNAVVISYTAIICTNGGIGAC